MANFNLFLMVIILKIIIICILTHTNDASRAFFIFGDSLVDSGNNNYLGTTARANAWPYGIDHPSHLPTGRFCNGLTVPDFISQELGVDPVLPYLSPDLDGENLLLGANFASAGVGILNDTGIQFMNIIRIMDQLQYFEEYQHRLRALIGTEQAARHVNKGLVLITIGGNDFVNNYYLVPFSARSREFALIDYVPYVISELEKVLTRMYELGARRVLVTGMGPVGCAPAELAERSINGDCSPELQRVPDLWNPQLLKMLSKLNGRVGSDVFVSINAHKSMMDFFTNPQQYGFESAKIACCGQGPFNGLGLCTMFSNVCENRDSFVFWDAFHPTERSNRILFRNIMSGSNEFMYPMNLSTILALDADQTKS